MQRREEYFSGMKHKIFVFLLSASHVGYREREWVREWRKKKFMRRPCEILNLRFRVHWVWEACTSFNLEWNCFNIHAIVYYECFFYTTSSFRAGDLKSCWQIYNFRRWFQSSSFVCDGGEWKIIGETAYFVCCASCLRHISALELRHA